MMDFFSNSFSGESNSQPVYSDADAYSGKNQILETPSYLDTFKSENFKNASVEERMNAFQALEHDMAKQQGRKERQIVFEDMQPDDCGYYTSKDDKIHLNSAYISDEGAMNNLQYDGMDTVIHEGRHATQADCINGYCDPPDDKLSRNMEGMWDCEVPGVYTEGKKTGNYRLLPNEYDAFNYANDVMSGDMSKHFNDDPAYNDYVAAQRKSNEVAVNDAYNSRAAQYLLQEDHSNYNDALNNINTVAQFQSLEEAYQNPQYYQNAQQRLDDATNTLREHSNPETLGNEYAHETAEKYRSMGFDVPTPSDAQKATQNRPNGAEVKPVVKEESNLESNNQNKESNEIKKNEGENEEKPSEESEAKTEESQENESPESIESSGNSEQNSENSENAENAENSEENGAKPEQEQSAKENSQTDEPSEQAGEKAEQDNGEENAQSNSEEQENGAKPEQEQSAKENSQTDEPSEQAGEKAEQDNSEESAQNNSEEQENGTKPEESQENQSPENADSPENSEQNSEKPENAENAENSEENGAKPDNAEQNSEKSENAEENGAKPEQDNSSENGSETENSQGANDSSNAAQSSSGEQSGNYDQDKDQGEESSPPPAQSETNDTAPSGPSNDNSMDMGE